MTQVKTIDQLLLEADEALANKELEKWHNIMVEVCRLQDLDSIAINKQLCGYQFLQGKYEEALNTLEKIAKNPQFTIDDFIRRMFNDIAEKLKSNRRI